MSFSYVIVNILSSWFSWLNSVQLDCGIDTKPVTENIRNIKQCIPLCDACRCVRCDRCFVCINDYLCVLIYIILYVYIL